MLAFLPHQITDLNALVEAVHHLLLDYVDVASVDEYKPFIEALAKYQSFAEVKNVGAAIHAMTKLSLREMDAAGYTGEEKWVQLSSIFGSSAISQETAEIISSAVKKMIVDGVLDSKNKVEFVRLMAEKYLSGA